MKTVLVYLDKGLNMPGKSVRHVNSDPLGIRYLASALENAGHSVMVRLQGNKTVEETSESILKENPDAVGISALTYNMPASQELAYEIKKRNPGTPVIFGGEHPSLSPETTFNSCIDYIVKGEGEQTLTELINALENGERTSKIPGIYINKGTGFDFTYERLPIEINSLPWPKRDNNIVQTTRMNSLFTISPENQTGLATFLGSRGCSFNCIYCSSRELWSGMNRFRGTKDVVSEILAVQQKTGANVGVFYDLTFNANQEYLDQLCKEMIRERIGDKMSFYATTRISDPNGKLILTHDVLKRMKSAGIDKIGVGIESFDDFISEEYKSGISPWQNTLEAVSIAHAMGILVRGFLIIGGPHETHATYEKTKQKLNQIPLHDLRVGYLTPFPGTPLDKIVPREQRFSIDLDNYDCSRPIIKNPSFTYQELIKMEDDLLKHFHLSIYRDSIIKEITAKEPRIEESARWREKRLKEVGLC